MSVVMEAGWRRSSGPNSMWLSWVSVLVVALADVGVELVGRMGEAEYVVEQCLS